MKTAGVALGIVVSSGAAAAERGNDDGNEPPDSADIYVAPDGDDDGAGTADDPYASLGRVASALDEMSDPSGTLVYCRGGSYAESGDQVQFTASGSADAPIRIEAYPGETPEFDLSDVNADPSAVRFVDVNHVAVRGVTFEGADGHDVDVWRECIGVEFRECRFMNASYCGLRFSPDDETLDETLVVDCEAGFNWLTGENSGRNGFNVSNQPANPGGLTFRRCVSHHNGDDGFDLWGGWDHTIEYSISYRNGYESPDDTSPSSQHGNGYKLSGEMWGNGNNLIKSIAYDNDTAGDNAGIGVSCNDNAEPHTVHNVTSVGNGRMNYWLGAVQDDVRNCISYDDGRTGDDLGSATTTCCTWTEDISDPEFALEDFDNRDFLTLASDSPCIEAGTTDSVNTDSYPYEGAAPDIGALEYDLAEQVWEDVGFDLDG